MVLNPAKNKDQFLSLLPPKLKGQVSLEETLEKRRSVRSYSSEAISLAQLSQLLWAAQGITSPEGFRTTPSAGALYPLEIYAVAGSIQGLEPGVYKYFPFQNQLQQVQSGDCRAALARAALFQDQITQAPLSIVMAAVYRRITVKYGTRGQRYVHIEVGHAGQNICLQAIGLGLTTCVIGAFYEDQVQQALGLPKEEEPLYILTVGYQKTG